MRAVIKSSMLAAGVLSLSLGLQPASAQGIGDRLRNLFGSSDAKGASAAPPSGIEVPDCPRVDIIEGGSALRTYAGGRSGSPESLRSQLTIVDIARECIGQPDGSIVLKVGVEGRALVGPAGSAGRFDAPVRFVVKRGDQFFANRVRRVAVVVPPGETQATFVAVEENIVIPPGAGEFDIEVGLGAGAGGTPAKAQRGRQRG
jgi:hypothetical protein